MHKKWIWVFVLFIGAAPELFAQGGKAGEIIIKQMGGQGVKVGAQQSLNATISNAVGAATGAGTNAALKGGISGAVNNGAVGALNKDAINAAGKAVNPATKTASSLKSDPGAQMMVDLPYVQGLHERIEQMVTPSADGQIYNALQENFQKIKAHVDQLTIDDMSAKNVSLAGKHYMYLKENQTLLVQKGGIEPKDLSATMGRLEWFLRHATDEALTPVYDELTEFIGTKFHYPQQGTRLRSLVDDAFVRFPFGEYVSPKFATFKFLQRQRDFFDFPQANPAPDMENPPVYYPIYDFMPVANLVAEKYPNALPAWNGDLTEQILYNALDEAIILKSVGAPSMRVFSEEAPGVYHTDLFTLDQEAVFVIPEQMQHQYVESVYERLQDFVQKNYRFPYFSADAPDKVLTTNASGKVVLTDEARLHLAVRRALTFLIDSPAYDGLEELTIFAKKLPGTKMHDMFLPRVVY